MGTNKRERQKTARQEKIEELRRLEKKQATRRRGTLIGLAVAAFLAFAIGYSVLTAGDDDDVATTDDPAAETETETETEGPGETAEPLPCPQPGVEVEPTTDFPAPPEMCIDPEVDYTATVVTDAGTIEVDLFEDDAPLTVNNFVYLARYRYFDGLDFHRVIPDFVLQGGDPNNDGTGGPGYQFEDELPQPEDYKAGSLAMANSGPNTNGGQFFIVTSAEGAKTLVDAVGGTANYSLFGEVTEGMDVVAAIEADGSPAGTPTTVHVIESVTINEG